MIQILTATYEDGVLKPDEQLNLPAQARVRLAIEPLEDANELARRQKAWDTLQLLWQQTTIDSQGERLSREQLHERH